ncbi:MAG: hypothetical protein OFPII_44330 [Osedax symbiont Rs1]|nr:MAG: hypothetical protein OFPII_44330 [Osedax symbiont Rs1]
MKRGLKFKVAVPCIFALQQAIDRLIILRSGYKLGYRDNILKAVDGIKSHPIHHGVKMQAHHLVSNQALKESGVSYDIEHLGYDINHVSNIALIPCTLQGACHLNVQLHRGNHPAVVHEDNGNNDDDDSHPPSYHKELEERAIKVKGYIDDGDYCEKKQETKLLKMMRILSKQVARDINNHELALTSIFTHFGRNTKGCCDADSIPDAKSLRFNYECSSNTDHLKGKKARTQKIKENITFAKPSVYKITAGN